MSAVWKEHGYREHVLVADNGEIVSRIIRVGGWGEPSEYIVGGYSGKRYISLEQAKHAAERDHG